MKLQLLEEILDRDGNSSDDSAERIKSAPIDFCYVRPCHLSSINSLCNEFFWPGIDLSESLQYPDFSIVALYKKLVVGFGFLVPDVAFAAPIPINALLAAICNNHLVDIGRRLAPPFLVLA